MENSFRALHHSGLIRAVVALALAFAISGCQKNESAPPAEPPGLGALSVDCDTGERTETDGAWIDPATSESDCSGIRLVYKGIKTAELSNESGSTFQRIFGGPDSASVLKYLNARVHYIVPGSTGFRLGLDGEFTDLPARAYGTVATNMGLGMFRAKRSLAQYPNLRFYLGRTQFEMSSPASGVIHLGQGFSEYPLIVQMETMVHEARHSDCDSESSDLCGFPHEKCPVGHDYSGQSACDGRGIGPYFVGAVYAKSMADSCRNCSGAEKEWARITALDGLSRVSNLKDIQDGREFGYKVNVLPGFHPLSQREAFKRFRDARKNELGR